MGGSFLYSLTVTDVATTWTECTGLLFRDQETTLAGLVRIRAQMPVVLRSFDSDNGTEFINETVFAYCTREGITFTRSRPYKKNDQCFIEQKNGNVVRRNIGYDRFEGMKACRTLDELHSVLRLYVNFFQPSVKLIEKTRQGSKTIRTYDKARTPYQRVIDSPHVSSETKEGLTAQYLDLDPVLLLERLRACQDRLWAQAIAPPSARASRPPVANLPATPAAATEDVPSPERATSSVAPAAGDTYWRKARRPYTTSGKPRTWRTREDPFEAVWEEVLAMLHDAPYQPAKAILERLQQRNPGIFPDNHLRTLQRRVHRWRTEQAVAAQDEAQRPRQAAPIAV